MAFEELDARVIGSSITVRLEQFVGGTPTRPPFQSKATAANAAAPRLGPLPPAPKPEVMFAKPEDGSRQARSLTAKTGWRKLGGVFVMKPLSAERLRVALTVGCVGALAFTAGTIYMRDGWKFFKGFLPTVHNETRSSATSSTPPTLVAGGAVTQAPASAVTPSAASAVVTQAAAVIPPTQPAAPVEVHSQASAVQPFASAPAGPQQANAPVAPPAQAAAPAPVAVEAQPVKKAEVQPVPQALIERAPLVPLPAAPKIVRPRVVHQEAPARPQPHEAPAAEQNSPILVGGQFSKGKESK